MRTLRMDKWNGTEVVLAITWTNFVNLNKDVENVNKAM
jgi:hypothetical protein